MRQVQTLSRISEFYSSGSIVNVVKRTLTTRRVERLPRKPFSINELIGPLAKEEPIYVNTDQARAVCPVTRCPGVGCV